MKKLLFLLLFLIFPGILFAQEVARQIADDLPWYYNEWLWFIVMLVCVSTILIVARNVTREKIEKSDKVL
jgi:hypothetical protein